MKITTQLLKEKKASSSCIDKFIEHFPSGEAEYQDVLDKLAELNDANNARWLLNTIGKTDAVLKIDGDIESKNLFFGGSIKVTGFIKVDFFLIAGGGIKAGLGIEAGDSIKAGLGFGVYAGLKIRLNYWPIDAKVSAKTKPENLVSGFWVESSEVSK